MVLFRFSLTFVILLASPVVLGSECAVSYSELDKTDALKALKISLPHNQRKGFVNETKGSYFFISENTQFFNIIFYTTGLFDLYGIRREGILKFCDSDGKISVIGLDRTQMVRKEGDALIFDEGKPKQIYREGPIPADLAKANKLDPLAPNPDGK